MDMPLNTCVISEKVLLSKDLARVGSPRRGALGARVATLRTQKEFELAGTVRHMVLCANDNHGAEYQLAMHDLRVEVVSETGWDDACAVSEEVMSGAGEYRVAC